MSSEPTRQPVPVFWSGLGNYRFFRIPVLHRAGQQLLAFAEGRSTLRDSGSIDIVLRRSSDSGDKWGPIERVLGGLELGKRRGGTTVGNPTPLYLARSRTLLLLFCSNYGRVDERAIRRGKVPEAASRRVWISRSANLGQNWSQPEELTSQVKRPGWTWYAVGPGGAIRLRNGTLVVPATHASEPTKHPPGGFDHSHTLSSHDFGASWHVGAAARVGTNEATIAQRADGKVLLNARYLVKPGGRRSLQLSDDGGASWGESWDGVPEPRMPSWSPSAPAAHSAHFPVALHGAT